MRMKAKWCFGFRCSMEKKSIWYACVGTYVLIQVCYKWSLRRHIPFCILLLHMHLFNPNCRFIVSTFGTHSISFYLTNSNSTSFYLCFNLPAFVLFFCLFFLFVSRFYIIFVLCIFTIYLFFSFAWNAPLTDAFQFKFSFLIAFAFKIVHISLIQRIGFAFLSRIALTYLFSSSLLCVIFTSRWLCCCCYIQKSQYHTKLVFFLLLSLIVYNRHDEQFTWIFLLFSLFLIDMLDISLNFIWINFDQISKFILISEISKQQYDFLEQNK